MTTQINAVTKRPYTGVNQRLLEAQKESSTYWYNQSQLREANLRIKDNYQPVTLASFGNEFKAYNASSLEIIL